jgi:hypothetical protein
MAFKVEVRTRLELALGSASMLKQQEGRAPISRSQSVYRRSSASYER